MKSRYVRRRICGRTAMSREACRAALRWRGGALDIATIGGGALLLEIKARMPVRRQRVQLGGDEMKEEVANHQFQNLYEKTRRVCALRRACVNVVVTCGKISFCWPLVISIMRACECKNNLSCLETRATCSAIT